MWYVLNMFNLYNIIKFRAIFYIFFSSLYVLNIFLVKVPVTSNLLLFNIFFIYSTVYYCILIKLDQAKPLHALYFSSYT